MVFIGYLNISMPFHGELRRAEAKSPKALAPRWLKKIADRGERNIGRLDKVGKVFHALKKLSESSHLQSIQVA